MPEQVFTSALANTTFDFDDNANKTMVEVSHVSMVFNMANERLNNLKEYAIALARRELMFKEFRALDDISFEVKEGDVFGILGTNGSGKSTMLKIVAGVLEPSEGHCTVNGNIAPLIELGAGFDMDLTARENIYLNGALLGYPKKFINGHFEDIVDFAEIRPFLDMPLKNYSSGMVARIAFSIATVIVPEILIVDEVLSVGDFMFQKKCEDRISALIKEHNVTVLIVSHSNDQIERLCNKAIWIEKGHMRLAGKAKDVCNAYRLLGGHIGSETSEQVIFEGLTDKIKPRKSAIKSIEADNRFGMAARFSRLCYKDGADTVIIASGDRDTDSLLVTGLAGALDAPVLLIQPDHVHDVTATELVRLSPSKILLINSGGLPKQQVHKLLEEAMGQAIKREEEELRYDPAAQQNKMRKMDSHPSHTEDGKKNDIVIEVLQADTYPELSRVVYAYGHEHGLWGSSVILTYPECVENLASLSPYTYGMRCPVLLRSDTPPAIKKDMAADIVRGGFTTVIVAAGDNAFPEAELAPIKNGALNIVRLHGHGKGIYYANELIDDWITEESGFDFSIKELLVSDIQNPGDLLTACAYAYKNRSVILLENPQDLDSVAHAMHYIKDKSGRIECVTFIGDRNRFSNADKQLLAKIVTKMCPVIDEDSALSDTSKETNKST